MYFSHYNHFSLRQSKKFSLFSSQSAQNCLPLFTISPFHIKWKSGKERVGWISHPSLWVMEHFSSSLSLFGFLILPFLDFYPIVSPLFPLRGNRDWPTFQAHGSIHHRKKCLEFLIKEREREAKKRKIQGIKLGKKFWRSSPNQREICLN